MNWKLRTLLWYINTFGAIRQVSLDKIDQTRKRNLQASALGKLLLDKRIAIREIKDFHIDGIKVRLYKNSNKPKQKVIVYFHGGGFIYYNIDSHDYVTRRLCAMNDCTVISVDYRLAPEHPFPAAHEDAYRVIEYIYDHANDLGVDAGQIIVAGDSAGGNLSACACHHFKHHKHIRIAAQVLIYPWIDGKLSSHSIEQYSNGYLLTKDAMVWFQQIYTPDKKDRLNPEVSPIYQTDFSNLPPAFVLTAEFDPLKDEGKAYADKLKTHRNIVLYKDYPQLVHGFFNIPKLSPDAMQAYYDIQAFLRKVLD